MNELLLDVTDLVATVTLNRPGQQNALSGSLLVSLREMLAELDARSDVRAIVLTGADPAFCAGADLAELRRPGSTLETVAGYQVIPELGKPLIAAVNGAAISGGLELALACDFIVASELARFADAHGRTGQVPGWGLTAALPEAVGLRRAREMSATGNSVGARTALEWGLVNHVVPHADVVGFAVRLAADAACTDPEALETILAIYAEGSQAMMREALQVEEIASAMWRASGVDRGVGPGAGLIDSEGIDPENAA